jgi:hypothetical protein
MQSLHAHFTRSTVSLIALLPPWQGWPRHAADNNSGCFGWHFAKSVSRRAGDVLATPFACASVIADPNRNCAGLWQRQAFSCSKPAAGYCWLRSCPQRMLKV